MKKVYLIGNAHLDPVWLWRRPEGLAEIKSTFRSALDRMKEFPDYIFTCACASYYAWVEQIDPDMFEEIRQRVAEGRWSIVGGMWVQPDCNLPSGEAFARHMLYSQRYFQEKFGVRSTVGYNVDSFGHNGMLPQLLRQGGMDAYIFMRPGLHENSSLPGLFKWQSPDGSEVATYRIPFEYTEPNWGKQNEPQYAGMDTAVSKALELEKLGDAEGRPHMSFYGVGNHGGGPTVRNLQALTALMSGKDGFAFSSVQDYFDDVKGQELPLVATDLQHHASGCYAALSSVKAANRRAENTLMAAEKYDVMASALLPVSSEKEQIGSAWKKVLFNQFHDILAGCCIREAYEEALDAFSAASDTAASVTELATQRLSWKIRTTRVLDDSPCRKNGWILWEKEGEGAPLVVFNPHSFPVITPVQVNVNLSSVTDSEGTPLPIQLVRGPQTNGADKWNTLFSASLPAFGYATYYLFGSEKLEAAAENELHAEAGDTATLENSCLRVTYDPATGCIIGFTDKEQQRELASGPMARPIVIDNADADTWAHGIFDFCHEEGSFDLVSLSVIETGPVRAGIRVVSRRGASLLTQDFYLYPGKKELFVRCKLDFHEELKYLKLSFSVQADAPRVLYSMPYGFLEKETDGREEPAHKWMAVYGENGSGLALTNDGKYSFSAEGGDMRMTIARSCFYADHFGQRDDFMDYEDMGEQWFSYTLLPFDRNRIEDTVRSANLLNLQPTVVLETHHDGCLEPSGSGLSISADNVIAQTVKYAEDGEDMIIRLYETAGRETDADIELSLTGQRFSAHFGPQEIKTFRLSAAGAAEVNFLEEERGV